MLNRLVRGEAGYSLVEVIVSIFILTAAIIPMVGMFDAGLNAAVGSGDYDKARALANRQVEAAKALTYEEARDKYPNNTAAPNPTITSSPQPAGVPGLQNYTVVKEFVTPTLGSSSTDRGIMKVTVTVRWKGTKSYSWTGVVSR